MVRHPPALGRVARCPQPSPPSSPAHPRWVYTFSRGCQAAPGARRSLVGRRWVSLAGGGWGGGCQCAVPLGARPVGSAGWGAGRSLCRGLFPKFTKARRFVHAPPSMLHSRVSPIR